MITCHMICGRNGARDQFTDCGLESVTLHVHMYMCTVEELSVIVSIYTYSWTTHHSTEVDIIILSASIIIYCKSEITTIYIIIIIIL